MTDGQTQACEANAEPRDIDWSKPLEYRKSYVSSKWYKVLTVSPPTRDGFRAVVYEVSIAYSPFLMQCALVSEERTPGRVRNIEWEADADE